MVDYLIVDEGVFVLDALLGEGAFVVVEEVEVQVLHGLDVFEDGRPVVVEVRLQIARVPQVHTIINYIYTETPHYHPFNRIAEVG